MKDYVYLLIIAVLGGALAWQVFFPPASATDLDVAAARQAERLCLDEKAALQQGWIDLNTQISQLGARRDQAEQRAAEAEGKVQGLNDTIAQRNRELAEHRDAMQRLQTGRDELMAVNKRIEDRLALLQKLKREGSARSEQELTRLLSDDVDGFLILGDAGQ